MNLNNLNMNYKIILGISSLTILILFYKYIKDLYNPKIKLIEPQTTTQPTNNIQNNNNQNNINQNNSNQLISQIIQNHEQMLESLNNINTQITNFNNIYKSHISENLIPTQIIKTIIHLSSITNSKGDNTFELASFDNSGLREFNSVINLKLLGAVIPYIPHNIYKGDLESNHNKLGFTDTTITIDELEITEGQYDIHKLINIIHDHFDQYNINITFDNTTKYITIDNQSSSNITINPTIYPLFKRLGYINTITINNSDSHNPNNIPDLSLHYIDIIYDDLHPRAGSLSNDDGKILKRIPLTSQMGSLVHFEANHGDYISQDLFFPDSSSNISTMTFNFKRHDGTEYDFKGIHYDLKLEITELIETTYINQFTNNIGTDISRFETKQASTNS